MRIQLTIYLLFMMTLLSCITQSHLSHLENSASCNVLAINKERLFTNNLDKSKTRKSRQHKRKSVVQVKGVGDVGPLKNAYWCPDSSENLCGVNILKDMGYMVILDDYCTIVDRDTDATVVQAASIN